MINKLVSEQNLHQKEVDKAWFVRKISKISSGKVLGAFFGSYLWGK